MDHSRVPMVKRSTLLRVASVSRGYPLLILATFLLAACRQSGPGGSESSPSVSDTLRTNANSYQKDSSGVLITETTAQVATAPLKWEIDPVPTLAIGSEEIEAQTLFDVRGLRSLSGGGVMLLDAGSQELRFFDSSGQLTHRVGRKGEGPGEFQNPYLVQTLRGDSLLVWDGRLKRFQLFSATGEFVRTISLSGPWPTGSNPPLGAVGENMLAVRPEAISQAKRWALGPLGRRFDLVWHDPATGNEVSIATFRRALSATIGRSGNLPVSASIPFTTRPYGTVTDSSAMVYDGVSAEVREHGVDGEVGRIFRVTDGIRRPVDAEVIDGYLQYHLSRNPNRSRREAEDDFNAVPSPDSLPAFRSLLVDEVGWIWAEVYHWVRNRQSGRWMIFDPEGRARGILDVPDGLQVLRVGGDFILGVRFDELGVEHVLRYSLRRGREG